MASHLLPWRGTMVVTAYFALYLIFIVAYIAVRRAAFRTSLGWGFIVLLVPFGSLIFSIKHWGEVGKYFLIYTVVGMIQTAMIFTVPEVLALYADRNPGIAMIAQWVNPNALAAARHGGSPSPAEPAADANTAKPTPHEVRDLAETEAHDAAPRVDLYAAQRAAYAKHAKDLATSYQQLNTERGKLKPGPSAALTAFNAKAAKYQQGIASLADEKAKLDALDHATNLNADAATALASLQASAASGDYEAFAATMKKVLDEDRQTPSFPAMAALARTTLAQATDDKVAAGVKAKAAKTARAEFDKTTRQVQGIVNQTPPMVAKPPAGAQVYGYGYHPGANPPDYRAENLQSTREFWKGDYIYINEAPGVYYRAADCEFNPQTKFFFTSRTVPKKRLSDAEYQELTRLYRQLGQQEKAVADAAPPAGLARRVAADLDALRTQLNSYAMK